MHVSKVTSKGQFGEQIEAIRWLESHSLRNIKVFFTNEKVSEEYCAIEFGLQLSIDRSNHQIDGSAGVVRPIRHCIRSSAQKETYFYHGRFVKVFEDRYVSDNAKHTGVDLASSSALAPGTKV